MVKIMENPYFLMDDLGVKPHYFRKHPIWIWGGKFPQNNQKKTPEICKEDFGGKIIPWKNNNTIFWGVTNQPEVGGRCNLVGDDWYNLFWTPWLNEIQRPCPFFTTGKRWHQWCARCRSWFCQWAHIDLIEVWVWVPVSWWINFKDEQQQVQLAKLHGTTVMVALGS